MKKSTLIIAMIFLLFISASAVNYSGEIGLNLNTDFKLQPRFDLNLICQRPQLTIKIKNGFIDWKDSLLIPSQAVSASLFSTGYDFKYSLLGFDWRYEKLLSNLGDKRHFIAHRIKVSRGGWPVYLDFFETSVVVGDNVYIMYNHLPFLPVYLVQHIGLKKKEVNNQDINVCMGFNLGYQLKKKATVFCDVIVDDFPAIPWVNMQLPVMGMTLGYTSQELPTQKGNFQFALATTANTRYLHAHWGSKARYINSTEFLGDDLGPDALRQLLAIKYKKPTYSTEVSIAFEKHGPGDLNEYWVDIGKEEAYKVFFLSDIAEQKLIFDTKLKKNITESFFFNSQLKLQLVFPKEARMFKNLNGSVGFVYKY